MNILLLTTSYPLQKKSRSGIFIQKMIEHLPAEIDVTVLTPDDSSTTDYLRSLKGGALVPFRYAPKRWQRLAHGDGGIIAALAENRFNLLLLPFLFCSCFIVTGWLARKTKLIHANWSINGVLAGIVGLLFNKPVITTLRGSDVNLVAKSWLMRQLAGNCLSHSKYVVTVSPALRQELVRQFPAYTSKIKVIGNGVDAAFFVAGEKRKAENNLVHFLYAGNLVPGKGVHVILAAVAALSGDNWRLDIVGDGAEREKLETFCQTKNLQEKVTFHGSVAPEQMPKYMSQADVFVFASFAEGRPNVVLEAMAAGLPVLAAAIPALRELIVHERQGLLFPPGDAQQLSTYMARLLDNPEERRNMGSQAQAALTALHLSWPDTANQYAALYKTVLS